MSIDREIYDELERAIAKFPGWPTDPFHALAIVGEEYGELQQAVVQATYEPGKRGYEEVRAEAIQTAAMAIRFARNLDHYATLPSAQHEAPKSYHVECCADGCGWDGPVSHTCYLRSAHGRHIGPLCPKCHEVTEPTGREGR